MKLLIVGPQLSGKTTLVRHLRKMTDIPISEIDEEILKLNNNQWPTDDNHKDTVLIPRIYQLMVSKDNVIFFIQSSFPAANLQQFKQAGFKIILLRLSREEIVRRNAQRMINQNYDDATPWIDGQIANHEDMIAQGLIDDEIDATSSVEDIARRILKFN